MTKRILTLALATMLILGVLSGCSNSGTSDVPDTSSGEVSDKISVVTTIFPPYDFVKAIAGDKVELTMLLSPGGEVHSYEPSASDLLKVNSCDVFIYTGGESDEWVDEMLENAVASTTMKAVKMVDSVTLYDEEIVEGMEHDEEESHADDEEHEHEIDEHVWTSPKNAMKIVQSICDALCEADVKNAAEYQTATADYIAQLTQLDNELTDIAANASTKLLIFADRFPFRYLAEDYGFEYYAAFTGCSNQGTAGLSTLKFLADKVTENNISTVFYIEFSSEEMADTICESTGCQKRLLHSCHNVTRDDFDAGVTYIELMNQNAQTLREVLA